MDAETVSNFFKLPHFFGAGAVPPPPLFYGLRPHFPAAFPGLPNFPGFKIPDPKLRNRSEKSKVTTKSEPVESQPPSQMEQNDVSKVEPMDHKEELIQQMLRQATVGLPTSETSTTTTCSTSCNEFTDNTSAALDVTPEEETTGKSGTPSKPKMQKCKQCPFQTKSKEELWEHLHQHINPEKAIRCPKCPFVTEYKHHLEYHIRNHLNSKPFQCTQCSYRCVNKSMLNSHMKSHTNVYQYRCANCSYATKYSHSLKQHLKKYCHQPATVLNPDGTIPEPPPELFKLPGCTTPFLPPFLSPPPHQLFSYPLLNLSAQFPSPPEPTTDHSVSPVSAEDEPMDLSLRGKRLHDDDYRPAKLPRTDTTTKLESIVKRLSDSSGGEARTQECGFCGLVFRDNLLFRLHMEFHSDRDGVFTCAQCKKPFHDSLEFNSHLMHASHA